MDKDKDVQLVVKEMDSMSINKIDQRITGEITSNILDRARTRFSICAQQGIDFLIDRGLLDNVPQEIASFLLHCRFLDRIQVGVYLAHPNNDLILECYLNELPMMGLAVDVALRRFIHRFQLPGEAQQIDRLMKAFALRYHCENSTRFISHETPYVLSFAIILLNTDLHNPQNPYRMSKELFIRNVQAVPETRNVSVEQLEAIYEGIAKQELMSEAEPVLEYALSAAHIEGMLWKKSDNSTFYSWNRRWCVVVNGCLYYFYSRKDRHPRGVIPLENLTVRPLNKRGKFRFEITVDLTSALLDDDSVNSNLSRTNSTTVHTTTNSSLFACSESTIDSSRSASVRSMLHSQAATTWIKSAKFVRGQLVEGRRDRYIFQSSTEAERDRWVEILNSKMQKRPVISIVINSPSKESSPLK